MKKQPTPAPPAHGTEPLPEFSRRSRVPDDLRFPNGTVSLEEAIAANGGHLALTMSTFMNTSW